MSDMLVREAAKALRRSERTIKRWLKAGAPGRRGPDAVHWVDPAKLASWDEARKTEQRSARVARLAEARAKREAARPAPSTPASGALVPTSPDAVTVVAPLQPPKPDAVAQSAALVPPNDEEVARPPRVAKAAKSGPQWEAPTADVGSTFARVRQTLERDPEFKGKADLWAAARTSELLRGAASVAIVRLPADPSDLDLFGRAASGGECAARGLSRADFPRISEGGGLLVWIESELGPGRYVVEWRGPALEVLSTETVEVADLTKAALLVDRERKRAYLERRRAREEQWREQFEQQFIGFWVRAGLVEAARRDRTFDRRALSTLIRESLESYGDLVSLAQSPYQDVAWTVIEPLLPTPPSFEQDAWALLPAPPGWWPAPQPWPAEWPAPQPPAGHGAW